MSNFAFVQITAGSGEGTPTWPASSPVGDLGQQVFGTDVSEGDAIIAFVTAGSVSNTQGPCGDITDSQGNEYSLTQQEVFNECTIYAAIASASGPLTVNNNVGGTAFIAAEYSSILPFYICPGSTYPGSFNTSNTNLHWNPSDPTAFSSTEECMVIWGRSATGRGVYTAESGTIRYQGAQQIDTINGYCFAFGDDDQPSLTTSYSNTVSAGGGGCSVILNLTNAACCGGISAAAPPQPPGAHGTGQPDSSVGTTGTSALPAANTGNTLVYFEQEDRWMYHRNALGISRFYGFLFDGIQMLGLTGTTPASGGSDAVAYNIDDFRGFLTEDEPVSGSTAVPIQCVYQSHFEDAGQPDNQKNWLEVVVDGIWGADVTVTVYVALDNAISAPLTELGTFTGTGSRQKHSFPLGDDGMLATNITIAIAWSSTSDSGACEIHNVYLYYYVEARLALAASTLATDLGTAAVKQCKELMLDIDTSGGAVGCNIYSDLPGNVLAVRQTPTIAENAGRAIWKYPFSVTEGFLWRVALTAAAGAFRLYSARLLMRPVGVYVEAYESLAGFVYDSEPHTFESGLTHIPRSFAIALAAIPIKRFRELSVEIETFGGDVTVAFLTDLPGNIAATRCTWTVNTGTNGRRYMRLPLPLAIGAPVYNPTTTYGDGAFCSYAGNPWQSLQPANSGNAPFVGSSWWQPLPIEGRMCRLQTSGSSKYVIYEASVEFLPVGEYIEAYEAAGGAVYDSRETDFGSKKPKEARELELDIETTGDVTATVYCDLPGFTMAQCFQNTVATTGRQKILLPLTLDSAPFDYPVGRLWRLVINGSNAFRLYGATLKIRELGCYLTGDEASADPAGVFDTTPIDFGSERLKEFKKLEIEAQTDGAATLTLWTDSPNGAMVQQLTCALNTGGVRQSVKIPLTPGIRGRRVEVEISGAGTRLFAGRIWWRPLNEPKAQWTWGDLPIPPTPPQWTNAPFAVSPTPPAAQAQDPAQWTWGAILSIAATPPEWQWVDLDVAVSG